MTIHLPMDAAGFLSAAQTETGITLVDEAAVGPLTRLIESYNADAQFTADGAAGMHMRLMRILKNRLRMLRDVAAHPEILDIALKPPVIINAMARTGSTKMQKVLAATGDFNWLPNWKVLNPSSVTGVPHEDVLSRIEDVKADEAWFDAASPDAKLAHSFAADEPEEDSMLMAQSLISPTLTGYADADRYVMWTLEAGMQHQFLYLRDALKYMIWQGLADPQKPFVLKSAMSYGFETDLLKAFPGAKLIMTHRDPLQCIPSACRLIELFNYAHSHKAIDHAARFEGMAWKMDLHLAFRDAEPEYPILDISYGAVRSAATDVLASIYAFADMPLADAAVDAVAAWEVRNPKNKHGAFTYALADFGLTEGGIIERFNAYYGRFSEYF